MKAYLICKNGSYDETDDPICVVRPKKLAQAKLDELNKPERDEYIKSAETNLANATFRSNMIKNIPADDAKALGLRDDVDYYRKALKRAQAKETYVGSYSMQEIDFYE